MEELSASFELWLAGLGGVGTIALFVVMFGGMMVWSFLERRKLANDPETHMANDRLIDPRRAWVQGASQILMRLHDNAYLEEELIRTMLRESWGLSGPSDLDATVSRLVSTEKNAWGLLRAMLLLRSGVAVGWLSNEASFARCFEVGRELQAVYQSWDALGEAALRARRRFFGMAEDGSQDDEDMREVVESVRYLRSTLWKTTPWDRPLDRV